MDQTVTKVNVATVSFTKPVAMEGRSLMSEVTAWLSVHWKDLGLGVIVLFGVLTLFSVMKRAVPTPIEIPTLEERVLIDEEKAGKAELEALRRELAEVTRADEDDSLESLVIPSDELEKNLEVANTVSDQRPESVATVIRTWMSDASSTTKRKD
jgi:flagellar biosynthesis/type III secretory pathway M-ring protein FliF/YscJ